MIGGNSRGLRKVLILLAAVLLVGTASCGGGGGAQRLTDGAGSVGGKKQDNGVPVVSIAYTRGGYQISVHSPKEVNSVELTFENGAIEVWTLTRQGSCFSGNKEAIDTIKVMSKSGDYWYFDNAGNPIEDGKGASGLLSGTLSLVSGLLQPKPATPVIRLAVSGGLGHLLVGISSSVAFSQVKIGTAANTVLTYNTSTTSSTFDTQSTAAVEAIRVTLAADGSKWYFDAAGNVLPVDSKWYTDLD